MTLKEELEILRGEPIRVFTGNPLDIPCIETSDSERLCRHPVVSVHMITYNHEPYIRQAIEGVMMQKTDFEFELVIGEDCSTDRTREICFEYQKRYPDKIRVLWCDHNLYRNPHPAGGNGRRNLAHCRGEFIAICEGDDYWTDPCKLQKQVDVMRQYTNVGLCFCGAKILNTIDKSLNDWGVSIRNLSPGIICSRQYQFMTMFGFTPWQSLGAEAWQMTATLMIRKSVYDKAASIYDISKWNLMVGDVTLCLAVGSLADAFYFAEPTTVYRKTPTGLTLSNGLRCGIDTMLVRYYFFVKVFGGNYVDLPDGALCWLVPHVYFLFQDNKMGRRAYFKRLKNHSALESLFKRKRWLIIRIGCWLRLKCSTIYYFDYLYTLFIYNANITPWFSKFYTDCMSYECVVGSRKSIAKGLWHVVLRVLSLRH